MTRSTLHPAEAHLTHEHSQLQSLFQDVGGKGNGPVRRCRSTLLNIP